MMLKPVAVRSIAIPYDIMERLIAYARENKISVNRAITRAILALLEQAASK